MRNRRQINGQNRKGFAPNKEHAIAKVARKTSTQASSVVASETIGEKRMRQRGEDENEIPRTDIQFRTRRIR